LARQAPDNYLPASCLVFAGGKRPHQRNYEYGANNANLHELRLDRELLSLRPLASIDAERATDMFKRSLPACLVLLGLLAIPQTAQAIAVTPTNAGAAIQAALLAGNTGLVVDSITISSNGSTSTLSIGTFTNASGTYGIGPGVVISSGAVANYADGPNTSSSFTTGYGSSPSASQLALLTAVSGAASYFDTTEIAVNFHMDPGFDTVFFNVVFGSDEFFEYVNTTFIDAFGLFVDNTNIAFNGGQPINVNHSAGAVVPGTELDGVIAPGGNPVMTFSKVLANPTGAHTLNFIIADRGDASYDSTAYIGALGGVNPGPGPSTVPEPASLLLVGTGLGALARRVRQRKPQA